jgi:uncharacterized protein
MDLIFHYTCLIVTGTFTGLLSGLFGVGGGFLMTPVQYWLYTAGGMDGTLATRLAFGTSLAVILPTMIGGAMAHHSRGTVNWIAAIQMGITASFGGFTGGALATHLPGYVPRTIFALLIIMAAIIMVWHIQDRKTYRLQESASTFLPLGFGIGCVAGISGIGGGILLVPALVILLGYPIHLAAGTSSATLIFSSLGAVTAYISSGLGVANLPPFSIGYVNLISFSLLTLTTIPLAQLGVRYAHRCSARSLQCLFALLLLSIGVLLLVTR